MLRNDFTHYHHLATSDASSRGQGTPHTEQLVETFIAPIMINKPVTLPHLSALDIDVPKRPHALNMAYSHLGHL